MRTTRSFDPIEQPRKKSQWPLGICLAIALAACSGGSGGGEVLVAPLGGGSTASGSAPANVVNQANVAAYFVQVQLGASSTSEDTVTVTIAVPRAASAAVTPDGGGASLPNTPTQEISMTAQGTNGAGTVNVGPFDLRPLPDGVLELYAQVRNANGQSPRVLLGTLLKDVVAPEVFGAGGIAVSQNPVGPSQPLADTINLANVQAVMVEVAITSGGDPETAVVAVLSDGANDVLSAPQPTPMTSGNLLLGPIDASSLSEGAIQVRILVLDDQLNASPLNARAALKDVTLAPAIAFEVPESPENGQNYVSAATQSTVFGRATVGAQTREDDRVSLVIVQGALAISTDPATWSSAAGFPAAVDFPGLDLSGFAEGPVAVTVLTADANGNRAELASAGISIDRLIGETTSLSIPAGAAHGVDVINASNAAAVQFQAEFADPIGPNDTVELIFSSGAASERFSAAVSAAGVITLGPINLASLPDGPISVTTRLSDPARNPSDGLFGPFTKDTTAPMGPLALGIPAGASHPADTVNENNVGGVIVTLTTPADADPGRTAEIRISGSSVVSASAPAAGGNAVITFAPISLASFADGTLSLTATFTDSLGNQSLPTTVTILKDTFVAAVAMAAIPAGPQNSANFVAIGNVASTVFDLTTAAGSSNTDRLDIRVTDGALTINAGPFIAPNGASTITTPPVDLTALASGLIRLTVLSTDAVGNVATLLDVPFQKDVAAPAGPLTLQIPSSSINPADVINNQTFTSVSISGNYDGSMLGDESVRVGLSDGVNTVFGSQTLATTGAFSFAGLDASSLLDGPINVVMELIDPAGNRNLANGTAAVKSTATPALPTSINVAAGANNPAGFVNLSSQAAVVGEANFGAASLSTSNVELFFTGATSVTTGQVGAPAGAGTITFPSVDLSAFADGAIGLRVRVTDSFLSIGEFIGAPATKDTLAPAAPLSLAIPPSPQNPSNTINIATVASVIAEAQWDATADATASALVTAIGGASVTAPAASPTPSLGQTFTFDASSLADGAVSIAMQITDPAGNITTFNGVAATKDTVLPVLPTAANIPATANNSANFISAQSVSTVGVDVTWDANAEPTNTVRVRIDDGASTAFSTTSTPLAGSTQNYAVFGSSALAEGNVQVLVDVTDIAGNAATFTGTAAIKDTVAPAAPVAISVPMTGQNPAGFINATTAANTGVQVDLGANSNAGEAVVIDVTDGASSATGPALSATASGGTEALSFPGLDSSALVDGPVTIDVTITDAAGNQTTASATVTKDIVAPAAPTALSVPSGANNPADFVNIATASAVIVRATWDANADISATAAITAAGNPVSTSVNPTASSTQNFAAFDASGIADGVVAIAMTVTDPAGNVTTFNGSSATKDTVAPLAPNSASIPVHNGNPVNVINTTTANAVQVDLAWPVGADATATAVVRLSGGTSVDATGVNPTPNATQNVTGIDTTSLTDGPIAIAVTTTDPAGNATSFNGTAALKDTVAPLAPTALEVLAGVNNPANYVNATTVGTVSITATWPVGADTTASAVVTMTGGASSNSGSLNPVDNATQAYTLDATALTDGGVTIAIAITDPANNVTTFNGTGAIKDVIAPVAPTSARVPVQGTNTLDHINAATATAVQVDVVWDANGEVAASSVVRLSDGLSTVSSSAASPLVSATQSVTNINAGMLQDGAISVAVLVTDLAGNVTTFNGTSATKDVIAPASPTLISVPTTNGNTQGFISASSANAVGVNVTLGANSVAGESIAVSITDGAATATPPGGAQLATGGAQLMSFVSLNALAFQDGNVTVRATLTDAAGNETQSTTTVVKDVVLPAAPTSLAVPTGANNPANFVNIATAGAVVLRATWDANADPTATATITAAGNQVSVTLNPVPSSTQDFAPFDATGFADGAIAVGIIVVDPAGNFTIQAGTSPTKDTVAPLAPTSASIPVHNGNPIHVINSATANAVQVDLAWSAGADATATAVVRLTGGASVDATGVNPTPNATQNITGINASGLTDGAIAIAVTTTDPAGNATSFTGTAATKDTVAPLAPTALQVLAGVNNPVNYVNATTVGAVSITATWPMGADTNASAVVTMTGGASANSSALNPVDNATQAYTLDATALADGGVTISIAITDTANNVTMFNGTGAIKDVVAPLAPTGASIPSHNGNPVNVINSVTANAVQVDVAWPAGADATATAIVRLSGGASVDATGVNPTPNTTQSVTGIDASSLAEGAIGLAIITTDPAGNTTSFNGTAASKDTVAPLAPTALQVLATVNNPADYINATTVGAVSVTATWPVGADTTASAAVTLVGGAQANSMLLNPVDNAPQVYTIDATALTDGAVAVSIALVDPAGNVTVFNGTGATKDVIAPLAPTSASIPVHNGNPVNVINATTANGVQVNIAWPAGADATATAIVRFTGGATVDASGVNPTPSATQSVTGINASTLTDGAIALAIITTDPAGNATSFNGTAATKDTVAPPAPTALQILAGVNNPANFVNTFTVGAVEITATWPVGADTTASAVVTMTGFPLGTMANSGALNPVDNATQGYTLDASALMDGTISTSITITDPANNVTTFNGTGGQKDTVAPPAPNSARVPVHFSNTLDYINAATASFVQVDVAWGASIEIATTYVVRISDGVTTVTSSTSPPTANTTQSALNLNATALNDGPISVVVEATDLAGNITTFNGTSATKDVVAPAAATIARVPVHNTNTLDHINAATASAVQVDVTWDGTGEVAATVVVELSDGVNPISSSPANLIVNGAPNLNSVTGINCTALPDGFLSVRANITDAAGNTSTFAGTVARKDVVAPATPTSVSVPMTGQNPAGFINATSAGFVRVDVALGASSVAQDSIAVVITDGVTSVNPIGGARTSSGGVETLDFTGFDTQAFTDGSLTLRATLTDAAGNVTQATGTVTKDVVAPAAPTALAVPMGANNPVNTINIATANAVTVRATWDANADATATAAITAAGNAVSSAISPIVSSTQDFAAFDASGIADGAVALAISVTDPAGNVTNFNGTSATKDTVAPLAPTSASIPVHNGNPISVINATTANAVQVDLAWSAGADATATAVVRLTGGASVDATGVNPTPNATQNVTGINASSLTDGAIAIAVTTTDPAGNATTFNGTAASKDTVAPLAPTALQVLAGVNNPVNYVNATTVGAVSITATWPAGADTAASAVVTMTGGASANSSTLNPLDNSTQAYALDATALTDGGVTISIAITDTANNVTNFNGTGATKDVIAPAAPTSARVPVHGSNTLDHINAATASAVQVDVAWGANGEVTANSVVRLSDGVNTVSSSTANPLVSATQNVTSINAGTLNDGAISVAVVVTDLAGNVTTFNGTAATKDIVAPATPTSISVPMTGQNPAGFINGTSVNTVGVSVALGAGSLAGESIAITVTDGAASATPPGGAQTAAGGAETLSFVTINTAALNDGSVTVRATLTDAAGNETQSTATVTKDVVAPAAPTALAVPSGANNPANFVNIATANAVVVRATWDANADATATAAITAAGNAVSSSVNPTASNTQDFAAFDASGIADGAIALAISVTDPAGNVTNFNGTSATKDTVAPLAPTSASVPVHNGNPINVINATTASAVRVDLAWSAGADATATAVVRLTGGASVDATGVNPTPNATQNVTGINASALTDGAIAIAVTTTDPAGNATSFNGTAASKDTVAPLAPTALFVPSGMNTPFANYVNATTVGAVPITATWPAGADTTASAVVTMTGGASANSNTLNPVDNASQSFTLNATALTDGTVTIAISVTDPANNVTTFNGTNATKDVIAPAPPTSARVPAHGTNTLDHINAATVSAVLVDVVWDANADATANAIIALSDGVTEVFGSVFNPIASSTQRAPTTPTVINLNDGPITVQVQAMDPAGNITIFNATSATKDVVLPAVPTSISVPMTGQNPAGFINGTSVNAVGVSVALGAGSVAGESIAVTVTDGAASATPPGGAQTAAGGAETLSFVTINTAALNDGSVTVRATLTDAAGNETQSTATVTKDVVAPAAPTALAVPSGANNPADFVNIATANAVVVRATWDANADATATAAITAAGNPVSSSVNPTASNPQDFAAFDASGIADGAIALAISVTDPAGNVTNFNGTSATKDTVAPLAPTSASIPVHNGNPINVINATTANAVRVDLAWSAGADATATAVVRLTGGANVDATGVNPTPNATQNVTGINASALTDGAIAIAVTTTDPAGNATSFNGTAASKDTVAPLAPTALEVLAGVNNPVNYVNATTVGAVSVTAAWPAGADTTASAVVTMTGGASANSSTLNPLDNATQAYTLDATALTDGGVTISIAITDPANNVTNFNGTGATKDVIAPTNPTSAGIVTTNANPNNVINSLMNGAARVDVAWDANADATASAIVRLTDGVTTVNSTASTPVVSSTVNVTGINAASLIEGAGYALSVITTDPAGNTSTFAGTNFSVDLTPPVAPTLLRVATTVNNPVNFVNLASQGLVSVELALAAGAVAGESATVQLSLGGNQVTSGAQLATGGVETLTFTGLNATALAEGTVALTATITDANGNPRTFTGTATKDITPPAAPTSSGVAATGLNAANIVNNLSQAAVELQVIFPATSASSDQATLSLTSGATVQIGPFAGTAGVGTRAFVNQDLSSLTDGAVTVTVDLVDAAGNEASYPGTNATKDTIVPSAPTSVSIAAGGNNPVNVINSFNASNAQVDIVTPANTFDGSETLEYRIVSSGGGTLSQTAIAFTPGGTTSVSNINSAALADGNLTITATVVDAAGNRASANQAAIKDATGPITPTGANVPAGVNNPVNIINSNNQAAVTVRVTFASFDATDTVTVTLSDGVNSASSVGDPAAATVDAVVDASALNDGPISISVSVEDTQMNAISFSGTAATKAATPPAAPSSISVLAGTFNTANWISLFSRNAVDVRVVTAASMVGTETVALTITDGVFTLSPASRTAPAGGGNVDVSALNFSPFSEGAITITARITDVNGNFTTSMATVNKDTVTPVAPTGAIVKAGAENNANFITNASQSAVVVSVTYGATADANDRATVTLSDGSLSATSAMITAAASSTVDTVAFDATVLAQGSITLTINLTDLAGNTASSSGTLATKDTVLPTAPIVDPVTTPVNSAAQSITGAAQSSTTIEISDGVTTTTGTSDANGSFAVSVPLTQDATNTLTVRARDTAGNRSTPTTTAWNSSNLVIVQSTTAPSVPFADITVAAGVASSAAVSGGGFVDVDNDGDLDLFVGETGKLWRNDGTGVFTDVTAATGVIFVSNAAAVWADYDHDGDQDLFLTHDTLGSLVFRNAFIPSGSLTFSDATVGVGGSIGGTLAGAAWFDYNRDGYSDIFVADADGLGNELLRNSSSATFTGIAGSGLQTVVSTPKWLTVGDLDGDSDLDAVVGDATPGLLFINNGFGAFTNRAGAGDSGFSTNTSTSNGGIAIGDIDNDGDQDIIVASGGAGGTNQLWRNNGGVSFTEVAMTAGISAASGAYDVVLGDVNHDGRLDIYFACNGANQLWLNQGDQVGSDGIVEFVNVAGQAGGDVSDANDGRLAALGDIDGDGDLDLYVGNESSANVLWRNGINNANWLKVRVVGKGGAQLGSPLDAIGTRIAIRDSLTVSTLQYRWVNGGRGAGAQDPRMVHFGGLQPSRRYDIVVRWPNGNLQVRSNVVIRAEANQTVTITEL